MESFVSFLLHGRNTSTSARLRVWNTSVRATRTMSLPAADVTGCRYNGLAETIRYDSTSRRTLLLLLLLFISLFKSVRLVSLSLDGRNVESIICYNVICAYLIVYSTQSYITRTKRPSVHLPPARSRRLLRNSYSFRLDLGAIILLRSYLITKSAQSREFHLDRVFVTVKSRPISKQVLGRS